MDMREDGQEPGGLRLRRLYRHALLAGLLLSVGVHLALARFAPEFRPPPPVGIVGELRLVRAAPTVTVPPPPEPVLRPTAPEMPRVDVEGAAVGSPSAAPVLQPVPPPLRPPVFTLEEWRRPSFIPYRVPPRRAGRKLTSRELGRFYPRRLRKEGVEGIVDLWVFVDEEGVVQRARVRRSSGHPEMDEAAVRVTKLYEYLPAMSRDRAVGVWVGQRVCFVLVGRGGRIPEDASCEQLVTTRS